MSLECGRCGGDGWITRGFPPVKVDCPACEGRGSHEEKLGFHPVHGGLVSRSRKCGNCGGDGYKAAGMFGESERKCPTCNGTGWEEV